MDKLIQKLLRESLVGSEPQGVSSDEQLILDDLISMNEALDFNSLINKFKKYAKQGAITAGIVLSLLSNDALAQEQKQAILNVAQTTLSDNEVASLQTRLKDELGLEFNSDYLKNNVTHTSSSEKPALPSGEELMQLISKDGVPGKYLKNVYVDYIDDAYGNETAGVKISVRLQEEGNFKRLKSRKNQAIILNRVVQAIRKKQFKDAKGKELSVTLEVKDPDGGTIGDRPVKI